MPDNPAVNQPASGTYGEKADANKLKASLPQAQPGPAGPAAPAGPPPMPQAPIAPVSPDRGRPGTSAAVPPGVPSVLAAPTTQPDVPVATPLAGPVAPPVGPGAAAPDQARLAILDRLSNDPSVSPDTREWAKTVLGLLLGADPADIIPAPTGAPQ